jgi:hypothetical protein
VKTDQQNEIIIYLILNLIVDRWQNLFIDINKNWLKMKGLLLLGNLHRYL